ncbi:hypothetical protein DFP73DRAFT_586451 [Morchella snyderi]|nr:hypothetical protein DFP73DRAFT_586451 [Morchella snyderi]
MVSVLTKGVLRRRSLLLLLGGWAGRRRWGRGGWRSAPPPAASAASRCWGIVKDTGALGLCGVSNQFSCGEDGPVCLFGGAGGIYQKPRAPGFLGLAAPPAVIHEYVPTSLMAVGVVSADVNPQL